MTKEENSAYLKWIDKQIAKYPKSQSLKALRRDLLNAKEKAIVQV